MRGLYGKKEKIIGFLEYISSIDIRFKINRINLLFSIVIYNYTAMEANNKKESLLQNINPSAVSLKKGFDEIIVKLVFL